MRGPELPSAQLSCVATAHFRVPVVHDPFGKSAITTVSASFSTAQATNPASALVAGGFSSEQANPRSQEQQAAARSVRRPYTTRGACFTP